MRRLNSHSRSSLFLMEMILSLLILVLCCTACIQVFALSRSERKKAREYNHIQTLVTSVGELTEGWDGNTASFLSALPGGICDQNQIQYFYDQNWNLCEKEKASYYMELTLDTDNSYKKVLLTVFSMPDTSLYQTRIQFPLITKKEAAS